MREIGANVVKPTIAVPELMGLCNQLHAQLEESEGYSRTIDSAIWRLISPKPREAESDTNKTPPEPNTLEAGLRSAIRRLERLNGDLSDHCKNLDNAV